MRIDGRLYIPSEVLVGNGAGTPRLHQSDALVNITRPKLWRSNDCHRLLILLDHDLRAVPDLL